MIALSYGSMDAPTSRLLFIFIYYTLYVVHIKCIPNSVVFLSADYVELWIVMVSMISGCMMYTVLVANATTMIANTDPTAKEYKSKVLMALYSILAPIHIQLSLA